MLRRRVERNLKREIATFAVSLVVIAAVFFAVLNYFVSMQHPPTQFDELTVGEVRFRMDMPQTQYAEGEAIPLRLRIHNMGKSDVVLRFDAGNEFDFLVRKDLNLLFARVPLDIWRYSTTHTPAAPQHAITLKPGGVRTYEAKWTQVNSKGEAVGPGRYVIEGQVNLAGARQTLELRSNTE